jgi:hypothetical protein
MKSGHWITIEGAGLNPEYRRISLSNARTDIEAVERECSISNQSKN